MSELKVPWIVPLYNFDSDAESVILDKNLRLRRIEEDELENLLNRLSREIKPYILLLEAKYALEDTMGSPDSMRLMNDAILALRLFKAGDVKVLVRFYLHERDRVHMGIYGDLHRMSFSSSNYFLKKQETGVFVELWKKMNDAASKPYLEFPLVKFTEAYDSLGFDEKIVDYMTALESFVFYEADKSIEPAGEVMGIAIGMLLGNSQSERKEIKETLIKAYKVRNAKVHGNIKKLKTIHQNVGQLCIKVEDYLRSALRKLIEEGVRP
jgi:hypothetical protein